MPLISPETNEETRVAIAKQEDQELAAEILAVYHSAENLATQARAHAKTAVEEAIRCGAMLNAKKASIAHGFWQSWLELYLPEVQHRTAQRWMELARRSISAPGLCSPSLGNASTLRQAYIAVGMLPDPEEQRRERQTDTASRHSSLRPNKDFISLLHGLYSEKPVEAMLSVNDFSDWEHLDLELLEQELAPLATLRERIKNALGWPGEVFPSA